jgi:hypothetical protein
MTQLFQSNDFVGFHDPMSQRQQAVCRPYQALLQSFRLPYHWAPQAVGALTAALKTSSCYLEYGIGGSTVLAADVAVPSLLGVESDRSWMALVQLALDRKSYHGAQLHYVDIGPTGAWGHPVSDSGWRNYHRYPLGIWAALTQETKPDLVLIDGRFRVACALATLMFADAGTKVLFDDYASRQAYHVVEEFVQPIALHGEMMEFVVPRNPDRAALSHYLAAYFGDPA